MTRTLTPKIPLPDLAQRWGWKAAKLYRLVASRRIPHVRIGREIFFEEAALDSWLEGQRREMPGAQRERTREEECRTLGIEPDHGFT